MRIRAIVLALCLVACDGEATTSPNVSGPAACVRVGTVESHAVRDQLSLRAQLVSERRATIMSRQTGYVGDLFVDVGAEVSEGDVLAELAAGDLAHMVGATGGRVRAATARVQRLESDLTAARRELARVEDLTTSGAVATQRRDQLSDRSTSLEHALRETQASLAALESEHRRTRYVAGERTCRAPFDGVVSRRFVDLGELIAAFPPRRCSRSWTPLTSGPTCTRLRSMRPEWQRGSPST